MQSQSSYSQNEDAKNHSIFVHLPNGCEFSHLVDSAAEQRDEKFDAAEFDRLLTDYDRILLRFGMHITW